MTLGIGLGAAFKTALSTYRALEEEKRAQQDQQFQLEQRQAWRDEQADIKRLATGLAALDEEQNAPPRTILGPAGPVALPRPEQLLLPSGPVGPAEITPQQRERSINQRRESLLRSASTPGGIQYANSYRQQMLADLQLRQAQRAEDFLRVASVRNDPRQMRVAAQEFINKHFPGYTLDIAPVGANGEEGATLISPGGSVIATSSDPNQLLLGLSALISPEQALNVLQYDLDRPRREKQDRLLEAQVQTAEASARYADAKERMGLAQAQADINYKNAAAAAALMQARRGSELSPSFIAQQQTKALYAQAVALARSESPAARAKGQQMLAMLGTKNVNNFTVTDLTWDNPFAKEKATKRMPVYTNELLGGRWIKSPDGQEMVPLEHGRDLWHAYAIGRDNGGKPIVKPIYTQEGEMGEGSPSMFLGFVSERLYDEMMRTQGKFTPTYKGYPMVGLSPMEAFDIHMRAYRSTPAPSPLNAVQNVAQKIGSKLGALANTAVRNTPLPLPLLQSLQMRLPLPQPAPQPAAPQKPSPPAK